MAEVFHDNKEATSATSLSTYINAGGHDETDSLEHKSGKLFDVPKEFRKRVECIGKKAHAHQEAKKGAADEGVREFMDVLKVDAFVERWDPENVMSYMYGMAESARPKFITGVNKVHWLLKNGKYTDEMEEKTLFLDSSRNCID